MRNGFIDERAVASAIHGELRRVLRGDLTQYMAQPSPPKLNTKDSSAGAPSGPRPFSEEPISRHTVGDLEEARAMLMKRGAQLDEAIERSVQAEIDLCEEREAHNETRLQLARLREHEFRSERRTNRVLIWSNALTAALLAGVILWLIWPR